MLYYMYIVYYLYIYIKFPASKRVHQVSTASNYRLKRGA